MGNSHQRIKQKISTVHWHLQQNQALPSSTCRHTVYNDFISSRLIYGSEIYTNITRKFILPLIVTQNKILRILQFKNIKTPLNTLYREFGVLKLKDLHHFSIHCIVHKSVHSPHLFPVAINEIFCLNEQTHDYNTRNKNDLHPIKIKAKLYGEKTIPFSGRNCWNNLPSNICKQVLSPKTGFVCVSSMPPLPRSCLPPFPLNVAHKYGVALDLNLLDLILHHSLL